MKIQCFAATVVLATATFFLSSAASASVLQEGASFRVMSQQIFRPEGNAVEIEADAMITVIGERIDERGDRLVHVGVDSNSVEMPSEFWVRASELESAHLEMLDGGMDVDQLLGLEESGDLSTLLKKPMTYCYRFVKLYLLKKGLVRSYLPGGSAWMATKYLPAHGFRLTGRGPGSSRVNDVCVYSGGNGNNGHIEVRAPAGWYYGYGYKKAPISLRNHRLKGCFSKKR